VVTKRPQGGNKGKKFKSVVWIEEGNASDSKLITIIRFPNVMISTKERLNLKKESINNKYYEKDIVLNCNFSCTNS
jgi:hypothetical protein